MGVMKPDLVMKSIIPVVMAGVLGIYGLIIAVIIANQGVASLAIPRPPPCSTSSVPPHPSPILFAQTRSPQFLTADPPAALQSRCRPLLERSSTPRSPVLRTWRPVSRVA